MHSEGRPLGDRDGDARTGTAVLPRPSDPFAGEEGRSPSAAGTVKWFNDASGYGFIAPDDGGKDLYVRTGSIVGASDGTLSTGERVEFEARAAGMGPEAIGVRRLATAPTVADDRSGG